MQECDSWPDWPPFQFFVLKSHTLIHLIDRDGKLSFCHVEQNSEDALLLELLITKRLAIGTITVPQLPITVEGPTERIVTESRL